MRSLHAVTLLVRDYDEAIGFYVGKLGFALIADVPLGDGKRWVLVAPSASSPGRLLLARAATDVQRDAVGNQAGGRVFLFLHTDDFARDHASMLAAGITFVEQPRHEAYGIVAVFADLYGNRWDLIEPKPI